MAWKLLPVNYTDAVWSGLKRYNAIQNEDGSVSFQDVTTYSGKENSFFGAKDANRMNEALNTIMSMVENGTSLYEAFQLYFQQQKALFDAAADETQQGFTEYMDTLKVESKQEITDFESEQEALFTLWFNFIKGQLSEDSAGNLQNQINALDTKTDGFVPQDTSFSADGKHVTETSGNKRIETEFVSYDVIIQKLYIDDVLAATKTITFSDGNVKEEVS